MKNNFTKVLAVLLTLCMLMGMMIVPAVAAESSIIKSASITLTSGITNDASELAYGSIAGMIDGDVDGPNGERYYQSKHIAADKKYYSLIEGKFVRNTSSEQVYYGYATFELTSNVALESMTIWLAGDNADQWKAPENNWGINDAYDILYSTDGVTWTVKASFENMCGIKSNNNYTVGEGFPAKGEYGYHELTHDGYTHVGHRIAMDGIEATYIAIAIKGLDHSGSPTVVIGDVTFEEQVQVPEEPQGPAFGEEVVNGDLITTVNFSDPEMWGTDYGSSTFDDAKYEILNDGASAKITLKNEGNRRVLWGGLQGENDIEWTNADKRTVVFKALFGSTDFYFGIQTDWDNALTIRGNGWVEWHNYNNSKHPSTVNAERWNYVTDVAQSDEQTFAVEVDYSCNTMTLFVMNKDGSFSKVVSKTWADAGWKDQTEPKKMGCRFFATRVSGDPNDSYYVQVSDLRIYDGLVFTDAPEIESPIYVQKSLDGSAVRFIGVVNLTEEELANFSALGFNLSMTYNGKTYTKTYTTTTVYTSLIANGNTVDVSELGGTYFYAVEINGLDAAEGTVVFNVDGITVQAGSTTTNVYGSVTVEYTK